MKEIMLRSNKPGHWPVGVILALAFGLVLTAPALVAQDNNALENRLEAMAARLQVLEDREAIRAVLEEYVGYNESRDYRAYAKLFASSGELILRRGRATGPDNIHAMMEENFGGAIAPDSPLNNASHILSNVIIDVDGDTATASSRWTLVIEGDPQPGVLQAGFYLDKLVRENGRWKFQQRLIRRQIPFDPAPAQP